MKKFDVCWEAKGERRVVGVEMPELPRQGDILDLTGIEDRRFWQAFPPGEKVHDVNNLTVERVIHRFRPDPAAVALHQDAPRWQYRVISTVEVWVTAPGCERSAAFRWGDQVRRGGQHPVAGAARPNEHAWLKDHLCYRCFNREPPKPIQVDEYWNRFAAEWRPGDELWRYNYDEGSQTQRTGLCIVRGGEPIAEWRSELCDSLS